MALEAVSKLRYLLMEEFLKRRGRWGFRRGTQRRLSSANLCEYLRVLCV
jgi:hypothetical protein